MLGREQEIALLWTRWFDQHGSKMLGFARHHCRVASDAEDLLQEVITELWQKSETRNPPDLPLIYFKIRQRAVDHGRSQQQRSLREEKFATDPSLAAEDELSSEPESQHALLEALAALPEKFRQVVSLKLWNDLSFDQIAAQLNIPRGTAASRYRLALAKLKQSINITRHHG